ncbi:hypothetical protein M1D72_00645 [Vibrio sp. AK197]
MTSHTAKETYQLHDASWALSVFDHSPSQFELTYQSERMYLGQLEVLNNGELLTVDDVEWRFRHKTQRIEQWCQLRHSETLSVNMNYYFHQGSLVIEYLARNSVPTRLDIRHSISTLQPAFSDVAPVNPSSIPDVLKRQRNGMPSEFLSQTEKTDFFREAFSATQWIVLNKM